MNQFNSNLNIDSFWSNPMFNNFNNTPQSGMNTFISGFQNNQMNNLQPNFNNFRGNMNQTFTMNMGQINMNPMSSSMNNFNIPFHNINNFKTPFNNSINNFNASSNNINMNMSMNDSQFRKLNLEKINQSNNFNNIDSEIQINFRFMNTQSFKIKAKPREKLKDVIARFKINECPKELKEYLSVCLCNGEIVKDLSKTLFDLNIKNGEQILFMKSQSEEKRKKEEMKYVLTEREKEQANRFKLEYEEKYLHKKLNQNLQANKIGSNSNNNNNNKNEIKIPSFIDFLKEKERKMGPGIHVKEHDGRLVYCLTKKNWKCSICNIDYSNENARYYCGICGFSMCENCHYQKKYFMKKSFPKDIKPSNPSVNIHAFFTDYHKHRLVYCRSSRSFLGYSSWICDNCRENFYNREWSFYCTQCDFDLCCDCCGFH